MGDVETPLFYGGLILRDLILKKLFLARLTLLLAVTLGS